MQSSSSSRVFNPTLAGASPATDAICSQGVISSARRSAKAEVRGASPRESTIFNGDHDVTAASRPVKAFVPVRIRLVTPTLSKLGSFHRKVRGARAARHMVGVVERWFRLCPCLFDPITYRCADPFDIGVCKLAAVHYDIP